MKTMDNLLEGKVILRARENVEHHLATVAKKAMFSRNEVNPRKVFVMTYDNSYTCNPSYIVDEIARRHLPVDIVFAGPGDGSRPRGAERMPANVRIVRRGSAQMIREQATSRVWVDNALNCLWYDVPKKKSQVYINTWHGSMGIKRLSGDAHWLQVASQADRATDLMLTDSQFEEDVFRRSFWPNTRFLRYGHARNDVLLDEKQRESITARVRDWFDLDADARILLYAPTFRDNGSLRFLDLDYVEVKKALEQRFPGRWVILARMHFKNRDVVRARRSNGWLVDATDYPQMQELMVAADAGVTDYSSWAYDYVLTRKPLFLYAPDLKSYDQSRGFYYPLDTTPFPLAQTNEDLTARIRDFDDDTYQRDVKAFLRDKGCYETGQATKLAVDLIQKIVGL